MMKDIYSFRFKLTHIKTLSLMGLSFLIQAFGALSTAWLPIPLKLKSEFQSTWS